MRISRSRVWTPLVLVLGLGASYAIAQQTQQKPAAQKPAASTEPKEKEAPDSCPCAHKGMHDGMHEDGHEGMHGEGMHGGMHEGMQGGPMAGHECPMEQAGPLAKVKVEKTATGVVIRMTAKNAADVQKLQHMAEMMAEHMGSETATTDPHKDMGPHKDMAPKKDAPPPATKPAK